MQVMSVKKLAPSSSFFRGNDESPQFVYIVKWGKGIDAINLAKGLLIPTLLYSGTYVKFDDPLGIPLVQ